MKKCANQLFELQVQSMILLHIAVNKLERFCFLFPSCKTSWLTRKVVLCYFLFYKLKKATIQLFKSKSQHRTYFFKWDGIVTKIWPSFSYVEFGKITFYTNILTGKIEKHIFFSWKKNTNQLLSSFHVENIYVYMRKKRMMQKNHD